MLKLNIDISFASNDPPDPIGTAEFLVKALERVLPLLLPPVPNGAAGLIVGLQLIGDDGTTTLTASWSTEEE